MTAAPATAEAEGRGVTDAGEATTGGSWHGSPAMMMNLQHCSGTSEVCITGGSMMCLLLDHYGPC